MLACFKPIAASLLLLGAASAAPVLADDAPALDTVVATVDGTDITLGHMLTLRAALPEQFSQVSAEVLFPGVLDQLIQQTLLADARDGQLSRRAMLALENERRALIATEEMAEIASTAVTDEAVARYFEDNYLHGADVTEYKAAHILVETEEEAQSLVDELNDGANFAVLAQEHSIGPTGPSGGDLGWFSDGMMVEPFQQAVEAMEPGSISAPTETQFGWHVIKLEETRIKGAPDLEEVRDEIEESLRHQAIQDAIAGLMEKSTIDRSGGDALDPSVLDQFDLLQE